MMRGIALFVSGLIVGLAVHVVIAQDVPTGIEMTNHIGVNVPSVAEAVTYYSTKMGFKEAFRVNDASGQPRIVYMQISRNTFLELQPATPQRGPGFTHYGLVVGNAAASVDMFRKLGLTVTVSRQGAKTAKAIR